MTSPIDQTNQGLGADRALAPTASSQQAVSTKGFDHGEADAEAVGRLRASRNFAHNGIARVLVKDLDALLGEYSDTAGKRLADTIEALTRERDAWRARAYETADDLVKAASFLAVKDEALRELVGEELGGDSNPNNATRETDYYRSVISWAMRHRARAALNHKQEV